MIINFDLINKVTTKNVKGGNKELTLQIFADENYKIMLGELEPGASVGMHTHEKNFEILFLISGTAKILFDDVNMRELKSGECHYCPQGHKHSVINDGAEKLKFFAVSSVYV